VDINRVVGILGSMAALAAIDLVGALFAKEYAERHRPVALALGVTSFVLLFGIYVVALRFAELSIVTMGWIVMLQIGVIALDQLRYGLHLDAKQWAAIVVIIVLQCYLIVSTSASGLPAEASADHRPASVEAVTDASTPTLVVDLGGGSTELVLGVAGSVTAACSMDVGCVRMTERHLAGDPPSRQQVADATADVDAALDEALRRVPVADTATLVGVAGTVTTVTAHALRLGSYDPHRIHASVLEVDDVLAACADLLAMTHERRAALPFMHPGRVDVIGAGALVWSRVVERVSAAAGLRQVTTSEHDILDGIALSLV